MDKKNIRQEFSLENIDEAKSYSTEELNLSDLTSKKHEKVCIALNHIEHLLILDSTVTGCVYRSRIKNLCDNSRNWNVKSIIKKK